MIKLFKVPGYTVDTSKFKNLLHDPIREELEYRLAEYVGAKYAVAVISCTAGIFLTLKSFQRLVYCRVPSLVTTRFLNAITHSGNRYSFTDDNLWVGNDYILYEDPKVRVIDSAQRFDPGQYKEGDIIIFSNYPTKPLSGFRGGFVVGNDKDRLGWIRQAAYYGEHFSVDSWEAQPAFEGYQMFMDSVQAWFVNESLNRYEEKREKLDQVREWYGAHDLEVVTGNSYHLFRVRVKDNETTMRKMFSEGIMTGIHYRPAHLDPVYGQLGYRPDSIKDGREVLSLPFHEDLEKKDIIKICETLQRLGQA